MSKWHYQAGVSHIKRASLIFVPRASSTWGTATAIKPHHANHCDTDAFDSCLLITLFVSPADIIPVARHRAAGFDVRQGWPRDCPCVQSALSEHTFQLCGHLDFRSAVTTQNDESRLFCRARIHVRSRLSKETQYFLHIILPALCLSINSLLKPFLNPFLAVGKRRFNRYLKIAMGLF